MSFASRPGRDAAASGDVALAEHWEPTPEIIFLQLLLAAGYISKTNLENRVAELNRKLPEASQRSLDDIQNEANHVFDAIGMELVQVRDDFDEGNTYFALVTREPLPAFLNKLVMSPAQALQLKGILARMFVDAKCEGVSVDSLTATTFPAKQEIIGQMVDSGRFVYLDSDKTRIFIGTRLFCEIEAYLCEEYGGTSLLRCIGCEKWLLKGRLCLNEQCPARLHERCYDAFFSSRAITKGVCPLCSSTL